MNLQDYVLYIIIGIAIIAVAYLNWAGRKGQSSTEEPMEPQDDK